jgi:hypothetical protein
MYSISTISSLTGGRIISEEKEGLISQLVYDSRRIDQGANSLFFALKTDTMMVTSTLLMPGKEE